jgi:replicative DNA helicase
MLTATQEKEIPFNLAIEQAILGAILNNNTAYDKISDVINDLDFFDKTHQKLYKAIKSRLESAYVADLLTLTTFISDSGIDYNYVKQLNETIYPSENIRQYAEIMRELSLRRQLICLGKELVENAYSERLSIGEQIEHAEKFIFGINHHSHNNKTIQFFNGAKNVLDFTYNVVKHQQNIIGMETGFKDLDNLLGGLKAGELIILAGRPSMGKTAFATNICNNIALNEKNGGAVLFISLEMPYEQICFRIISSLSNVPLNNLLHAKITPKAVKDCLQSIEIFKNMPLYIYDSAFLTPGTFRSIVRQMKRQFNIGVVIVDYLQLMESGSKYESREQEISKISRSLKLVAKEISIPIIALSQMSRDIEKRTSSLEPKLSDLRGSGSIEQDADVILFLFREDNDIKVSVAKNRNGALGIFTLRYIPEITTFKNF